ncbi:MAG: sulfite exporter TauE/SafE family protein [Streptomycetaceae bacterium]|nr:sulfite exporter TauE/SafE family protein [Streptomycetaceae bacterium]
MALAPVLVGLIVLVAASLQRLTGIGFGLVAGPGLVLMLGPSDGVLMSNVASAAISALGLAATWREVRLRLMLPLVGAAMLTVPLGAWLVGRLPERTLLLGIGALVVTSVSLLIAGVRIRALRGRRGAVAAGAASGVMNASAGVGGPPLTLYAVNAGWGAAEFVANAQFYGVLVNGLSVATKGVPELAYPYWLLCGAAVVVGIVAGDRIGKVPDTRLRKLVLALALVGGVSIVTKGLLI